MAANQSTLDSVANQLSTLAAPLQQIRIENQAQSRANVELTTQVSAIQTKLEGPMAQMLTGTLQPPPSQVVPPETWQMTTPQGMDEEQPITAKQCAAMTQEALQQRVARAMRASFGALSGAISSTNNRVEVLEAEVRSLNFRKAWTERDILCSQIEQAKRTIMCRNFPQWLLQGDRELTVRHALTEAGLHIEDGPQLWELTTQRMVGDDGKEFSLQSPSSQSPTSANRAAIESDLDVQKSRRSQRLKLKRRAHGVIGLQEPSQAGRKRAQSRATRLAHRHRLLHLGHFHSPHRWNQS